jgi:hypothetical protein
VAPTGEAWQPIAGRAKAVLVLLFIGVAVALGAAVSDILEIDLLNRIDAGELVSDSETTNNDNRQAAIGLLQLGVGIATAVLFIMWFSRAYRNVERLGARPLRYKPGWAIGAWFVPILNLFRPKQIANDIWRGSDPDMGPNPAPGVWHDGPIPGLLFALWWLLWLVSGLSVGPGILPGDTVDEIRAQTIRYLVSDVATIPAAFLCAAVVGRTTRRQEARARAVA